MDPFFTINGRMPRLEGLSGEEPGFVIAGPATAEMMKLRERLARSETRADDDRKAEP